MIKSFFYLTVLLFDKTIAICSPGCKEQLIGNYVCDIECNNSYCDFDGGDCLDINYLYNTNNTNNTNNSLSERFIKLNLYFKLMIVGAVLFLGSFVFDFVVKTASGFRSIKSSSKRSLSSNIARNKTDKLAVEKIDKKVVEAKTVIETPVERRFYNNNNSNNNNLTVLDPVVLDDKKLARIRSSKSIKFNSDSREDNNNFKKYDLSQTIEKGKIIPCVLNSYVSSNLGGRVEAIVSQDIYAKEGNNILIPKGSKIFGLFQGLSSIQAKKIAIEWQNLHLPDGHVIKTLLRGVDSSGQDGHKAQYKYEGMSRIGSYILSSGVDLGLNIMSDKLTEFLNEKMKSFSSSSYSARQKVLDALSSYYRLNTGNLNLDQMQSIVNALPDDREVAVFKMDLANFLSKWHNQADTNKENGFFSYIREKQTELANSNKSSYAQSAINSLSTQLQNEAKKAIGVYEDFLYSRISTPIQIVVDDYIVFPDSYIQNKSRGVIIL